MLTFRGLLSAAVGMLLLASGVQSQLGTRGNCPAGDDQEQCTVTVMSSSTPNAVPSTTLTVTFIYCAPQVPGTGLAYGTGPILSTTQGSLSVQLTAGPATTYAVTGLTGQLTTIPNPTNTPSGTVLISNLAGGSFTATNPNTASATTVTITTNTPGSLYVNGISLAATTIIPTSQSNLAFVTTADCGDIAGDPLFTGFKGQQFYVAGQDGQVMNFISTFNMQLNGRFVDLQEGAALYPYQQEKVRLESEIAHQAEPSLAAFPSTTAWSHPGNYIAEAGVALVDDNRVYVKAGSFANGFAKVALNGRALPVSDDLVVFGQGVNTTYVHRVSAHELMVRTVNVEFTITNSDNFLNVEHIHMERGARQYSNFGGLLGKTADSKWSYTVEEEKAAVVSSNNLFEHTAIDA